MNDKPEKFIDDNGLRLDGRKADQIRDIKIEVGVLNRADGSCYLEMGNNKVMAAVYGPREVHPRHQQKSTRAIVRYKYNMASFSVEDRKRPGPDRRSIEVSKVSREALEDMVFTEYFPKSAIDIFVEILQADAGTRTAALNAASVALADAGIPMRGLVSACAVGKVDETLVLDLNKDEDNYGQADMPIAMTPDGKITLLQMDGNFTLEQFKEGLEMAQEGCRQVYEFQRKALMDYYATKKETEDVVVVKEVLQEEAPEEVIEESVAEKIEVIEEGEAEEVKAEDAKEAESDKEIEEDVEQESSETSETSDTAEEDATETEEPEEEVPEEEDENTIDESDKKEEAS